VPPDLSASECSYQFSAADVGASVLLSYSYVPSDIEDACVTMVGDRYKAKDRIGYVSKSLGRTGDRDIQPKGNAGLCADGAAGL
jgi:hypothetical protein